MCLPRHQEAAALVKNPPPTPPPPGAGNTPAVIDETANVNLAVSSILLSKTFDNGVICSTEQSVVVVDALYDAIKEEFIRRGAYFLNEEVRPA